jgi:hypothetical protein
MPQCLYQRMIEDLPVQCGKCIYCKRKRVQGWAFRLQNQDMHSCMSFFVTLTYDTENLEFCQNKRPTLYPNHVTLFMKIFRKRFKNKALKYYVCGEYGSNKKRPHYHMILFVNDHSPTAIEVCNWIETDWKYGSTFTGTVTGESIAYVLKYISKPPSVPQYRGDTRTPEFQRVSKGLGIQYLNDRTKQWHINDLLIRSYLPHKSGDKGAIPRYYKDKIYTKEQKQQIGEHMSKTAPQRSYEQLLTAQGRSPERSLSESK